MCSARLQGFLWHCPARNIQKTEERYCGSSFAGVYPCEKSVYCIPFGQRYLFGSLVIWQGRVAGGCDEFVVKGVCRDSPLDVEGVRGRSNGILRREEKQPPPLG